MSMNRAQRKAMQRRTGIGPAKLARHCYDIRGDALVRVSDPAAVAVLTRAFTLLLCSGGLPVAIEVTPDEARAFPRFRDNPAGLGVTWLAVGFDSEGRASYALQTANCEDGALASEAARVLACAKLAEVCATPGFPICKTRGRA
ncbi:hypothetical protein [Marinibacterium profundimaris]|uniref:Uncharacterized protein n=1 Tax=Marinibacterium profundimaris TaxID=1679460 RepID=A0A225NE12_9RHOB|nr:hypothetical protein [Marinibacterium profundimaris]OWU70507.1 hypothetical protein ATO3_19765 [Marinibacterium profundimaris]